LQAFKLAVDRQAVIETAFDGYATLGNDSAGATFKYWASDLKPQHDPEKAKSLLKAAGHEGLSLPLMTAPALPGMDETATIVSSQLKSIGVKAPLKRTPFSTYYSSASPAYMSDQRLLFTTYWNSITPSLGGFYLSAFTPGCQYNETGWGNRPNSQKLISRALAETDPAKAKQYWHDAQVEQVEKGGYLVPANFNYLDAYAAHVRGVHTTQAGSNDNFDYSKTWLAK
jgi:peptide/nickel transport system substrate-binding protein